ncbi:hypothetical protein FHR32_001979 [Streptosporangium album]|uniref:DUF4829 domain-containing protein n=1 Tax=Streptosporangium album TaxID=47479 RepID=A0A7W7RT30_9ACTN|nr:hypothetical protein [Streptosporangium album]MBB4937674.1 hypothetical protein [Streptosporangium album]
MTARTTRKIWIPVAVAVVLAGVIIATSYEVLPTLRVEWCKLFPEQRSAVATPPPDATPEQVVTAYLQAVAARDDDTARALSAPSFLARHGDRGIGCSYRRLDLIWVGEPRTDSSAYARLVSAVPTRYKVDLEEEGPEMDGERRYDFLVGRNAPSERWRIIDYGNG